jgi:hypothetical protein
VFLPYNHVEAASLSHVGLCHLLPLFLLKHPSKLLRASLSLSALSRRSVPAANRALLQQAVVANQQQLVVVAQSEKAAL